MAVGQKVAVPVLVRWRSHLQVVGAQLGIGAGIAGGARHVGRHAGGALAASHTGSHRGARGHRSGGLLHRQEDGQRGAAPPGRGAVGPGRSDGAGQRAGEGVARSNSSRAWSRGPLTRTLSACFRAPGCPTGATHMLMSVNWQQAACGQQRGGEKRCEKDCSNTQVSGRVHASSSPPTRPKQWAARHPLSRACGWTRAGGTGGEAALVDKVDWVRSSVSSLHDPATKARGLPSSGCGV